MIVPGQIRLPKQASQYPSAEEYAILRNRLTFDAATVFKNKQCKECVNVSPVRFNQLASNFLLRSIVTFVYIVHDDEII